VYVGNLEAEYARSVIAHDTLNPFFLFHSGSETAGAGATINGFPDGTNDPACHPPLAHGLYGHYGGMWYGVFAFSRRPPRHCFGLCQESHFTGYADVSDGLVLTAGQTPSGASAFRYGDDACGAAAGNIAPGQPIRNDWDCDPTHWDHSQLGAGSVLIGQRYEVRDVDCFDNSIAAGVKVGTAPTCV
jgi:hypothetical protein